MTTLFLFACGVGLCTCIFPRQDALQGSTMEAVDGEHFCITVVLIDRHGDCPLGQGLRVFTACTPDAQHHPFHRIIDGIDGILDEAQLGMLGLDFGAVALLILHTAEDGSLLPVTRAAGRLGAAAPQAADYDS